ncbi:hypothetical protein LGR49_18460, partial [Acinetobacter baumannii]|uniref:hypothetical protein n=1 Tax=Acinetobacter baumannii TaxID=470 RepID=UPI001CF45A5A
VLSEWGFKIKKPASKKETGHKNKNFQRSICDISYKLEDVFTTYFKLNFLMLSKYPKLAQTFRASWILLEAKNDN